MTFEPECPACGRLLDNHGGCWHCEPVPAIDFDTDYVRASLKADREVTVAVSLTYTATLPQRLSVEGQMELFGTINAADLKAGLVSQIQTLIQQAASV